MPRPSHKRSASAWRAATRARCLQEDRRDQGGPHIVDRNGGPEYESLGALGTSCGIDDLVAICKANELCNALGMDSISAGTTIAWAMEAYEHGLLSAAEADGLDLHFGTGPTLVTLIERIAYRQGLGDLLAEGRCARRGSLVGAPRRSPCTSRASRWRCTTPATCRAY